MKDWLKKYWFPILLLIFGLESLHRSVRSLISPGEFDIDFGRKISGIYFGLAFLVMAVYVPLKEKGKERIINILNAISGGIMFLSWLIVMFIFGDRIYLNNTIWVFIISVFLLAIGVAGLLGVSKESVIGKKMIIVILVLVLALISVVTFLLTSGIL